MDLRCLEEPPIKRPYSTNMLLGAHYTILHDHNDSVMLRYVMIIQKYKHVHGLPGFSASL